MITNHPPRPPMTLGNMRGQGVRELHEHEHADSSQDERGRLERTLSSRPIRLLSFSPRPLIG
jgi:hypothetical protein